MTIISKFTHGIKANGVISSSRAVVERHMNRRLHIRLATALSYVAVLVIIVLLQTRSFGMGLSFGGDTSVSTAPTATYLTSIPTSSHDPAKIAVKRTGELYVASPESGAVLIFSPDGRQTGSISGFRTPLSVAIDEVRGRVYVGDAGDGSVRAIGPNGVFLLNLGKGRGEFVMPGDIAVAQDGSVFVTDGPVDTVKVYAPEGGFKFSFGGTGAAAGQMIFPSGIFSDDANGEIYVVDQGNARVEVFDLAGNVKRSFSGFGGGPGMLTRPQGICAANGRVYVADAFQSNVEAFDSSGVFLSNIGQFGSGPGNLKLPKDIVINGARLYIANAGNQRIEVYSVGASSGLNIDPSALSFIQDASAPPAQVIGITPTTAGVVVLWSVTSSAPFPVILSQTSGTAPSTLTVSVDGAGLSAGNYSGSLLFHTTDADYTVGVNLTVAPRLFVSPSRLDMFRQIDGDLPAQSLAITSNGTLSWTASTSVPWLSLSPANGYAPGGIAVAANSNIQSFAEGVYAATVTVSAAGASGSPAVVPVSLKVEAAGTIIVNTNLDAAAYTIEGPAVYAGSGKSWRTDEARPGEYTLRFGLVRGSKKPASQTFEVKTGRKVVLDGQYRSLPKADVIAATKGPGPENDAAVTLLDLAGRTLRRFNTLHTKYGAHVAMGDVDGDGADEIIVTPGPGRGNRAWAEVYRQDGALSAATRPLAGTRYGANAAVGDIFGGGRSEIALGALDERHEDGIIVIYAWDDNLKLVEKTRITIEPEHTCRGRNSRHEWMYLDRDRQDNHPPSVAFGDVDGDGRLELLVGTMGRIEVYAFGPDYQATRIASAAAPEDAGRHRNKQQPTISAGDLNGDGVDEVLAGYEHDGNSLVQVLKGDLSPADMNIRAFRRTHSAPVLSCMDRDGDGLSDILAGEGDYPQNDAILRIFSATGDLVKEIQAFPHARYGVNAAFGVLKK
jgi:hypothetical protein